MLGAYSQKLARQRLTHFSRVGHTQNVSIFGEGLYMQLYKKYIIGISSSIILKIITENQLLEDLKLRSKIM